MTKLDGLLTLQETDLKIDRLNDKVTQLKSHEELQKISSELVDLEAEYLKNCQEIEKFDLKQNELESQINELEFKIKEEEKNLVSKNIGPRQIQDLALQIENHKLRHFQLQDQWIETVNEMESINAKINKLQDKIQDLRQKKSTLCDSIKEMLSSVQSELSQLIDVRNRIKKDLSEDLLRVYDAIRNSGHQIAAATVENSRCGSCHLTLPATELDRLKKSEEIEFCEQCGAILIC
jgi:predicted  nucleic acid-binding Zn-ribbon protein